MNIPTNKMFQAIMQKLFHPKYYQNPSKSNLYGYDNFIIFMILQNIIKIIIFHITGMQITN